LSSEREKPAVAKNKALLLEYLEGVSW